MLKEAMDLATVRIETDRLVLVPISLRYAADCFREFTAEITVFMNPLPPKDISDTEKFITDSMQAMGFGKELVCAITKKDTGEFLGCAGLHQITSSVPELGIWIKKSGHGHKFGQEAMRGLKEWADTHVDYDYIIYPVARDNVSSRKVAQSLGGVVAREYTHTTLSGAVLPFVDYRIDS